MSHIADQPQSSRTQSSISKDSPKVSATNRIPMWLSTGEFTQQTKQEIIAGRLPINHEEEVYLVGYLMQLQKEKPDRTEKILLKKLLMQKSVCPHLNSLPFELVLHFLEIDIKPRGQLVIRINDFYDCTCEVISPLNEISTVYGYGIFGEREVQKCIKSDVTVRCKTDCCFLSIKKSNFFASLRKFKFIELKQIESFLTMVPIIRTFGQDIIKKICPLFERIELTMKQQIVRQEQPCQYLWIILEGQFKSTFMNYCNQECNLLHFGQYEILGLESLLKIPSVLSISCYSNNATVYRIPTDKFIKVLKEGVTSTHQQPLCHKQIREFALNKINNFHELVNKYNCHVGVVRLARTRRGTDRLSDGKNGSPSLNKESQNYENIKLKTKFFSKDLAKPIRQSSTTAISQTIRSKREQPKSFYEIYQSSQDHIAPSTEPVNTMVSAYKEKLKRIDMSYSGSNLQLDIVEMLYPKTHRKALDLSLSHCRPIQHERSKHRQTEMLMKRIQMSCCRKRRNKLVCLFDPQQVIDFADDVVPPLS